MANLKRRCKQCGEYHSMESSVKTPAGWFCSREHAADFALAKSRAASERQRKAKHRQDKMDVKPIGYWMKRAQAAFNRWIRETKGGHCISCGRLHQGQMHAGHYRTTAAAPMIRFEPDNVWPQCQPCNVHLSGNLVAYRAALIEKVGLARVEWLEGPHEPKRYRREDYQAIETEYKQKLKLLQSTKE